MNEIGIFGRGMGGAPLEITTITDRKQIKPTLIGGELAQMALVAFKGGADAVHCVRVNQAKPSSLDLGDVTLYSQIAGSAANATHVKRNGHTFTLRNDFLELHEYHYYLRTPQDIINSLNKSDIATAKPSGNTPTNQCSYFDGGLEGVETLRTWITAFDKLSKLKLEYLVPATSNLKILTAINRYAESKGIWQDMFLGGRTHSTTQDMLRELKAMQKAVPYRIVANLVREFDIPTERLQTFAGYHLAAYVAARTVAGLDDDVELPDLKFILEDEMVEKLNKLGIIAASYHHESRMYKLS